MFEPKMMVTRKLRRRNYESIPLPDKRRRSSPFYILSPLSHCLSPLPLSPLSFLSLSFSFFPHYYSLTAAVYILSTLVYELDENDIEEDIKLICKVMKLEIERVWLINSIINCVGGLMCGLMCSLYLLTKFGFTL